MQLALVVGAQRDDNHIAILKFDQRAPEIIHSRRSVIEAYSRRQRDGRRVEAERADDADVADVLAHGLTRARMPRGPACSVLAGNVLLETGHDASPFVRSRFSEIF